MQDYAYSVFSLAAILIHLIINVKLLAGRGLATERGKRYRMFLMGVLFYYVTDAAWGIFAGLKWMWPWYADTILFFLSLIVFVFLWSRFIISYLDLGAKTARLLTGFGAVSLAAHAVLLAANVFNRCVFWFDAQNTYWTGPLRDVLIGLVIAYFVLMALVSFVKAMSNQEAVRRRSMMVFLFCVTIAVAVILQIVWPLTPFTALGCLICNCFFHVFVVQDEQAAKHTAVLEKALARAHAAEKARSMFFSIVSHDIRTPLNAILGYSELLQHGTETPAERDEALHSIRASGETLLQLVNDVLDLAKMDAGKLTLRPERVRLEALTDTVFASFRMLADQKGIDLVNRTADVPELLLDEHRFRQVLFNLVGNAVKFTSSGRVTVEATYADTTLEVAVSDTGCGIAPEMLTRILDPFVQVQDPSHAADRANGTGLGLSICKKLVEAMGGELVVTSEPGKGSTFTARLLGIARGEGAPLPEAKPTPADTVKRLPRRVLVIDDSPVNRAILTALLKKAGVGSPHHASNGEEALTELDAALKADRAYDFVFSDFWMPKMNGLEFIEHLRADPRFADLPVVAVTADTEFKSDARHKLFTGILLKPLTYSKLMEAFAAHPHPAKP